MDDKRVVEIDGVKVEVDLRSAKRVDTYKVGDSVKVLTKDYSSYKTHIGVIVGFDEFKKLPTITVAYAKDSYGEYEIKFEGINAETKDIEIAPLQEHEKKFDLNSALECFDRNILKKKRELEDAESKKNWFVKNYEKYFSEVMN